MLGLGRFRKEKNWHGSIDILIYGAYCNNQRITAKGEKRLRQFTYKKFLKNQIFYFVKMIIKHIQLVCALLILSFLNIALFAVLTSQLACYHAHHA